MKRWYVCDHDDLMFSVLLNFRSQRAGLDWPYSLALITSQARAADGDQVPRCATKEPEELAQHEFWPAGTAHLLPGNTCPCP